MRRAIPRGVILILAAVLLMLGGCEYRTIRISVPDFFTAEVEGIQMFRLDPVSGDYLPTGTILFLGEPELVNGSWRLLYTTVGSDGEWSMNVPAALDDVSGEGLLLDLWYARFEESGTFRAATFNEAGESALSAETVDL